MNIDFELNRPALSQQFDAPSWLPDSGLASQELAARIQAENV